MKEIIKVLVDDKNIRVIIDGDNIDLLSGVAQIIKAIQDKSDIPIEQSIAVIKKMLEGD